jgi:hypothetical protein
LKAAPKLANINKFASLDPMTDQLQHFFPAIIQPETGAGGTVAKGNTGVEQKPAVAQTQKDGTKKKGSLDGVRLK